MRPLGGVHDFFVRWFCSAIHNRLRSRAKVAKRIQCYLLTVLIYLQHGITNAGVDTVDATIHWLKKTARGFRNVEHIKIACCFHC
ncbi:MAG: transposase [Nitrospira sp.]|nr:transposase [Nitrospira sp.]